MLQSNVICLPNLSCLHRHIGQSASPAKNHSHHTSSRNWISLSLISRFISSPLFITDGPRPAPAPTPVASGTRDRCLLHWHWQCQATRMAIKWHGRGWEWLEGSPHLTDALLCFALVWSVALSPLFPSQTPPLATPPPRTTRPEPAFSGLHSPHSSLIRDEIEAEHHTIQLIYPSRHHG